MKNILPVILCWVFFNCSSQIENKSKTYEMKDPTIIELVISPEKFHLKTISIVGVYSKEGYLFFTKEDLQYSIYRNSFKIDKSTIKKEDMDELDKKYVRITGVFYDNKKYQTSGSISEVFDYLNLEDLLFEKNMDEYILKHKKK